MTVKRYEFNDSVISEFEDGNYVTYSDYQKLVAENAALRSFCNKLDEMRNDLNGEGTGIQGKTEVAIQQVALEAAMEEFDAINTPATDAAIAEIKAQGVDEFLNDEFVQEVAMRLADFNGETEDSVSTVVWSGMPPEPEGNVWELEYVSRASFLSRKLKEFAANLRAGRKG